VEYAPGEGGVIKAYYNTAAHTGMFSKTIRVKTNSVKNKDITLILKGKVFAELEVKNNTIFFYDLVPGKTKVFNIEVKNQMGKPLEIKNVKMIFPYNASNFFSLKVKPVKGSNGKEFIRFELKPLTNVYQFSNSSLTVKVKTNSKQVPVLTFYLRLKIKKPVTINPTALFLYTNTGGKTAPGIIELDTELDKELKIVSVQCKNCPLKFKVIDISPKSKQILVEPDYTKGKKGKIFAGIIKLVVDVGGKKEFSVPVRGRLY